MPSRRLHPDIMLSISIGCVMSRNALTRDPAPVIEELYTTAGDRIDLLTREVGQWVGFYEADHTRTLATALRALPLDLDEHIALGLSRRMQPVHGTHGFERPPGIA